MSDIKISDKEIYKRFFHGPKFQVHGGVVGVERDSIVGAVAANNGNLFSAIKKPAFIANPMLLEAALQNGGVYGMITANISSLPDAIGELSFKQIPDNVSELFIWTQHVGSANNRNIYHAQIVDRDGNVYSTLKEYKMITIGELKDDERFIYT